MSLGTPDGSTAKTNKAQLLHLLESQVVADELPQNNTGTQPTVIIVDCNALLQSLIQLPETFGELAVRVLRCMPQATVVHFVTDSYHNGSIKGAERSRRGTSAVHIMGGPMTKVPRTFMVL